MTKHLPPHLLGREVPPLTPEKAGAAVAPPPAATGSGSARRPDECEIRGRLLDAIGGPVAGREIQVRRDGGHWGGSAQTDVAGRYRYVTRETGTWRLSAKVDGKGTARAGPIEVTTPGTYEVPDLVLAGEGYIAGRAVFRDGAPADRIPVRAWLDRARVDPAEHLPGLASSTTHTDDAGRFRFQGLRPGRFHVQAPEAVTGGGHAKAVCGDENVHLVLDIHRLRIRVRDPKGRPLPDADVGMRWPDREFQPIGRGAVCKSDGCKDLWLEAGTRVIVAGHLHAHTVAEAEIVVPATPYTRDVDLVLVPYGDAAGSLRILLTDEGGRSWPRFSVVLTSALARSRLTRGGSLTPDADGLIRNVRPGRFQMLVWPKGGQGVDKVSYHFPTRREVTIRPRQETCLELSCRLGGRVLVREHWSQSAAQDDLEAYARLERADQPARRPLWLDPEEDDASGVLEPGIWTLVIEGEGVREVRRPVRVEAGRTVVAEVTLAPE